MKHKVLISVFAAMSALTACSQASAPDTSTATAQATKTKAVLIYADWCGSCKILDPKVKAIQAKGPIAGLEFVTLDYTAKDDADFYKQAEAAGVGDAVKTYLGGKVKTGQLVLVDLDDEAVIGKVTKTSEPADILKALKDAVTAS